MDLADLTLHRFHVSGSDNSVALPLLVRPPPKPFFITMMNIMQARFNQAQSSEKPQRRQARNCYYSAQAL